MNAKQWRQWLGLTRTRRRMRVEPGDKILLTIDGVSLLIPYRPVQ